VLNGKEKQMSPSSERRFDLDWMRVIAILVVFFFHSLRFFNVDGWHVKNATTFPAIDGVLEFMGFWMMPFIFVVSGASLYYALGRGNLWGVAGKFIKDKVLRLLVPLLVNVFSLTILQVYLERLTHGEFKGSFFDFLPHYFEGIYGFGGNFSPVGNHLWYLAVLFLFCLVLLPLFLLLKSKPGARALGWFTTAASFPGGIYLLALLFVLLWKLIDRDGILGFDAFNWNLGVYLSLLIFGFMAISSERLQRSIQRLRWVSAALAVAMTVWYILSDEHDDLVLWTYILTFLGFGMRYLNRNHPALPYASEAVLPFYILSQTVQLSVGYFILAWPVSDLLKWVLTTVLSLGAILALYEGLVRRNNLLRFLFGMKRLHKSPQMVSTTAQPAAQPR
jgi:glucans biosynthesis protein C